MITFLAAALALALCSLLAVLATERARSRITGPLGWGLTLLSAALAVLWLRRPLGAPEAIAVATAVPMAVIPALATLAGWRRRREDRHGRR